MRIIGSREILANCNGNYRQAAHYSRMTRFMVKRQIDNGNLFVIDGNVYIKVGPVNDEPYPYIDGKPRYEMYIDDVQKVLNETKSLKETCAIFSEDGVKYRVIAWKNRIRRWAKEGLIQLEWDDMV